MKLRELEVWEMEMVKGGDGGDAMVALCALIGVRNPAAGAACIIAYEAYKEVHEQIDNSKKKDPVQVHNESQWYWGETIRAWGNDGGAIFNHQTPTDR